MSLNADKSCVFFASTISGQLRAAIGNFFLQTWVGAQSFVDCSATLLRCAQRHLSTFSRNRIMNIINKIALVAVFAITAVGSVTSFAQTATPAVTAQQKNEAARINQGVASGELTKPEARTLRTEQRGIAAEKRAFKADGKVTAAERTQLHRDQKVASKRIYKKKHNQIKRA
jgi:hypothetical protein